VESKRKAILIQPRKKRSRERRRRPRPTPPTNNLWLGNLILFLITIVILSTLYSGLSSYQLTQTLNALTTDIRLPTQPSIGSVVKFRYDQALSTTQPTKVPTYTPTAIQTETLIPTPTEPFTNLIAYEPHVHPIVTDTPTRPQSTKPPSPQPTLSVTTTTLPQQTPTKPAQLFRYSSAGDWNNLHSARLHFSETPGGRSIEARIKNYSNATFDNHGAYIAVVSGTDLYLRASDNSFGERWLVETDRYTIAKDGLWSPDGQWFAFVILFRDCPACFQVAILPRPAELTALPVDPNEVRLAYPPPSYTVTDAPRWTVDGDLIVNAHHGEPSAGEAFIYTPDGQRLEPDCDQIYQLAASSYGQQYHDWLPGKAWQFCYTERADAYFND